MRDVGFFYIRHHGFPSALLTSIFSYSKALFTAPLADRMNALSRARLNL
jgi:isopenicillin N synthase-like dioxygenase